VVDLQSLSPHSLAPEGSARLVSQLRPALVGVLVLTLLTGVIFPLLLFVIGWPLFPHQAGGSLITRGGTVIGSALIGHVSLVVSLNTPSGAKAISSHGYDPSVQLPWSRTVSANWTIAGMLSVYWLTESGRRDTTGETTFLIDRQLMKAWDAFVEYAGDFPQAGGPRHFGALRHGFQTGAAPPARRSPWTGPVRVGSGPLYRDWVLVSLSGARAIEVCRSFSMHKLKPIVATTPAELAAALALSPADAKEWQVQHTLLKRLKEIVRKHKLTHAEIAKRSGTSRTRVTAILNDDIEHVSTDLLIRILSSLGYRVKVSVTRSVTAA